MKIETDTYSVKEISGQSTVVMTGTLRLQGREQYQPIFDLLMEAAARSAGALTVDMKELIFLNISGISAVSLFVIEMRKIDKPVTIKGSSNVSWQSKSLLNFQRLYEQVEIVIE